MNPNNLFLILGIGGSGMASLSHVMLDYGLNLIGYDKSVNNQTQILSRRGVPIFNSYDSFLNNLGTIPIEGIVYTTAVTKSPFIDWGISLGIPIMHRSKAMHALFSKKISISVAGSHGKTSTTGMIGQIFMDEGLDPSIMIGGESLILEGRGGRWGSGNYGIYESDESDGTFLNHCANYRVLTNIDEDHLDFYKNKDNLWSSFLTYLDPSLNHSLEKESIPLNSISIVYADDSSMIDLLSGIQDKKNIIAIGNDLNPEEFRSVYRLEIGRDISTLYGDSGFQFEFQIPFLGDHYRKNASLAIALSRELNVPNSRIRESLQNYKGVGRRMEILYDKNGIRIIDDYGHHPTEINAVISAMKIAKKDGSYKRTIVIFQPHRYSRTKNLYLEFAKCLAKLDSLYLLPIYSAGEEELHGVTTKLLSDELIAMGENPIILTGDRSIDCKLILPDLASGDIVLCLGAGNVREWGIELSQILT